MNMPATEEDDFTELVDYRGRRADLVGSPAHGRPGWLVMKAADSDASGLLDPEFVRDLIAKAEPESSGRERVTMPSGVTLSGSPADIAAFIHKAAVRDRGVWPMTGPEAFDRIAKAKYSADQLKAMGAKGHAFKNPDGSYSYPIGDDGDLGNAIRAVGRGGADHDAIRRYVIRRAKDLGAPGEIPENWASDGSLKEKVTKDMADMGPELDDGIDGMDPTVPLCEPDEMGPGDPTDPGSPAWESIDAATARKWTSIAVRFKNALSVLAEREMLEAASADPDDCENAWDLQDAQCALDYVIGMLAGFAVDEQAEADLCGEAMEAIGKAMAGFDPAPLDTIEGLSAVRKSGRVLSAANEAHIRDAAQALNTVLSSLPKAPQASDDGQPVAKEKGKPVSETPAETETSKDAAPVAKETATPEAQAKDTGPVDAGGTTGMGTPKGGPSEPLPGDMPGREVLKSALTLVFGRDRTLIGVTDASAIVTQVAKADGDGEKKAMQAVFDQDGDLIGIVDPDAIQPVTGAGGKPASDDSTDGDGADPADMTPQPPADAGTPADAVPDDDVAKSSDSDVFQALESAVTKAVAAALGKQAPAEDIAKQADVAGLLQEVETLKARLATVEEQPAAPKVFTNGQVPPKHMLRGQDQGAAGHVDVAKAAELRRQFREADPVEQNRLANEMQAAAIGHLAALHGRS